MVSKMLRIWHVNLILKGNSSQNQVGEARIVRVLRNAMTAEACPVVGASGWARAA